MADAEDGKGLLRGGLLIFVFLAALVFAGTSLAQGRLDGYSAGALILFVSLSAVVIANADRLGGFTVSRTQVAVQMQEIRQAKAELFARVDSVRELSEELAAATAFAAAHVGRFAPDDLTMRLSATRERLMRLLEQSGSTTLRRFEIVRPIDEMIIRDIAPKIRNECSRLLELKYGEAPSAPKQAASDDLQAILAAPDHPSAATRLAQFLQAQALHSETVAELANLWRRTLQR